MDERGTRMQSVPMKPTPRQIRRLAAELCVLSAAMLLCPPLCAFLTLLTPLLGCLLVGRKAEPFAWVAAAAPVVSTLLAGYDPVYAFSLLAMGASTLLLTRLLPVSKRAGLTGALWYTGAVAFSLALEAAAATYVLSAPLWQSASALIVKMIESSEQAGLLLYRLGLAGLLSMPEGAASTHVLLHVLEPAFVRQMALSLRLNLENLLLSWLPAALVQASLVVGLFTSLRVQRFGGVVLLVEAKTPNHRQTHVAIPPGFSLLAIPAQARWTLLGMAAASLVLLSQGSTLCLILGRMCFAAFETAYTLTGAAVLVWMLSAKAPERKNAWGVLTAALYAIAPLALFLIGLTDQAFHYRSRPFGTNIDRGGNKP